MRGAECREAQGARVRVRQRDEARGAGSGKRAAERVEAGQEWERDVVVDDDDFDGGERYGGSWFRTAFCVKDVGWKETYWFQRARLLLTIPPHS